MATEADVPEAISVMKGEGEDRYLISEQLDGNDEQCPPVEVTKLIGEPIQHPEMEKPCAVSENVQVESSALVDSKNNGFGISEGEHFSEPLSDISQADDQSNQAGLVMAKKTQDANLEVERVELASKYETDVDEHVQLSSNEEDSNKENVPCLEKEAESSQKDVEGEDKADEDSGMYRKEASALQEATTFQEYEDPSSNLDVTNDSFKKDTELETNVHKTTGSDPILQEETCPKITSDIGEDSQQKAQEYELEEEPQNLPEVKPEDAKTESECENAEVFASTEEERAVQNTQEYLEKNEPDLVHSTKENGNISEVFKATTEEQETEEHALPEIQNAEEETHVPSFKEEEKEADAKCEELTEVTDTTKEIESETVEQRIETSRDLDGPIPEEEAYAAESTKACDQNYSSISEESEVKTKEIVHEGHSAVRDYGLVSEDVGAESKSNELVKNIPEEKDSETILIDEAAVVVEDHGQAEDGLNSKEIIEKEVHTPEDEVEKDLKATKEENNGVACEEKDPAVVLADHPTLKTEEVEVQPEANVDSNEVLERQIPAAADESEEGKIDEQVTYTDITSEEKGLETIVTDEGDTCMKEAEEKNSHEEKALPIISADETLEVELQAEENVTSKENLERQSTPTIADEGDTCLRNETTHVEDTAYNTADITPQEKCLATISLDEKVPAIVADEDDKGLKKAEEENKEQITSRDISSEDKSLPAILTDEMAAENEGVEIQTNENVDSKESLEEENPAATEKGDKCVKEADEEKAPATILTDDKAEAIDYAGGEETENSNSKEILEEQIPKTVDEGELDLKEAEAEIKEEEGATDYAPEQKDAKTIDISKDETTLELKDVQEQENSTIEESLESQTPTEAEGETCMNEGEAKNMEQFTSAGIAAEEKGLTPVLSDERAKDIEDVQAEEKQIPKEAGEGEEKASHGNINVDDAAVNVYSTELEEAGPELRVEDEKLEDHPEKNHTIVEEVLNEPKIISRDFSEEQIVESHATVISPESIGEDTVKNDQYDEKETESIKEENASEISRGYIPEDATEQFIVNKCDEVNSEDKIIEDSQTAEVDESAKCETTNIVENSVDQFCTLPVGDYEEESPQVLEKYEPEEEPTKLPGVVENAEAVSYTKEETQESLEKYKDTKENDTSIGEACIVEAELSTGVKENIEECNTEEVSSSLIGEEAAAVSTTEHKNSETSLQVEKTEDHEKCNETIEGTREAKIETSDATTEVVKDTHIAALENKDNEATDVQEDEYFNSNDNFEKQIPTVAEGEAEQKLEVEDLPEKNNKICEEVVDEPNILGRDLTVIVENATNPTEEEAIKDYKNDEKVVTENSNEEERSTQNITEGDVKDISPEYVSEDSKEKYTDCLEEAFETTGEACNEVAELSTEAKKEEAVEESPKEETNEGHEVCNEAIEAKSEILEDTTEPKPILEEENKKSLDEDYSSSAQDSEKEREKEIEGEYTSTVRNIDSEVAGGEISLKEANTENEDLVESSHIASEEKENEGTGVDDTELVGATIVEPSLQAENTEEEARPKLEVANESDKSVLDEPTITDRDFNEEKLTQGRVVNFATESSVEETVTTCQTDKNETEKVNNEGNSIENIKEGDDSIISTEYAPEDSDEKLKECTQEEVESKEEILHESQTIAPEEKIIGSSEVVPESVPESIDEISQDEISAEQTTLDEVISKEPSTLHSEEKELADSEHEDKNIEGTLLPKEEPRELTYPEMAVENLGDGETEEPIKETCETVPVSEPQSIDLVSEDGIITDQTHCDGDKEPNSSESVAEIKYDSAEKTSDSESTSVVSKEEIITQAPVFADEHETQSVDKSIEEEEVPKEAQVPTDEEKPEVISEEPSTLLSEEKELVDSEPEHKNIEEEQAKDAYVPTEKDAGLEETLLQKEETRDLTFTDMADDKLDAGETEEPTENTSESVLVSEPRSIGLVSENEIITDQTHCDGEDEYDTTSVDKNIEEEEDPKEARVQADEEKPEEKCLQIEEPRDSDLAEQNSYAAETEEEFKRTVETVTEPEPESIIVASGDETVADQTVCEGITDKPLSTATDLDTSEMVSKSDSGSIEVVSSDEINAETMEQLQSTSSALLPEETEREVYEPDDEETTAQGTNVQECTKEFEMPADEHNQASLAVDSVEEEKCLQKEEPSEEITADETLSNKEVRDTPIETPAYTLLHEERELEACELDSEKLVADVKEGSDVIPQWDSQSSHEVSAESSIEEAAEVTSISRESPEATQILDQGEEQTQVETSEVADEIKVRESQLPEEVKASDNVGLEKLESELVPESDCKTIDVAAPDEVIAEQTLHEGTTNKQLQIPSSTLLSDVKELEVSEHEATTADKNIEEEQAAEVHVPTVEDKSVEETLLPKEEPRELKVSELALKKLDAGETKEETTETSETVLVSEPQSIGAVPDDEIITDETQCDDEKELKASHETLDAYTTDSALVQKCDSVSTDDVSKDEIIAEQTVEEDISREQRQIPSSALLADETMLKASDHEHESTCVDKSIDEVPCLQTEEAKDSESTLEKLEAGKTEDEIKETFKPVTQLESESIDAASGEETAADHNVCEGVVVDTPLSIAREFDTSELHMEKTEAEDTEEDIKVCPEIVSNIDSGSIKVVSSDEILAETKEQIQSPSSTLLPEEKECEASEPEGETTPQDKNTQDCIKEVEVSPDEVKDEIVVDELQTPSSALLPDEKELKASEYETTTNDKSEENKNLKEEVEEPKDEATQETEGVKETYETVSNSDFQGTDAVSKDDTTADQTHVDEIKEALEKQDAKDATEEVKEVSEVTPRSNMHSVPAKDEFIADQVLHTPSPALLSEENDLKESDHEYGTAIQYKATEKEPAEEIQMTDLEDTEEPRWLKLSELLAENINAGEIEEQTKEASETAPEVSSRSIGELSREEIADQIPPAASLLTEEKSYENTTTTDNAEVKSMNVVEEMSVPNEETGELNVSDLEFHLSHDTQKSISTEVNAASNEEKNIEVATSHSRAEDCATTTKANETAKNDISNEEIKDKEEFPKDSRLISVDQENIKESQEESEPMEERYANERKEQFNTAPSFKDYEVPEVKLDDTASKYHSTDEAEGIKPSNDTLVATEAIEEKSSESGVETTDAKSTPVSLSECLMDEKATKESKEVVTHLNEEKEHADEEEDDHEHVEEAKTDEEKEDTEHNGTSHGYDEPVIVEASRDSEVKVSPKKSHNILSGMGSKVKHSISKVKKAIIGKSSNSKTQSEK